jgi:hypothetical protein
MKNFILKSLVTTCVASVAIFSTPKASFAQVDMSLLTEVATSCQQDVFSTEYYQQLGLNSEFNLDDYSKGEIDNHLSQCIKSRYFYSLVSYKFPWLASTEEMLPGYPGFAAVSLIADNDYGTSYSGEFDSGIIDCLVSQDENSNECSLSYNLRGLYSGEIDSLNKLSNVYNTSYIYACPSCYVTYNNYPSGKRMIGAFIKWFMGLEPSHRKELVSILGDEQTARINRANMNHEADKAWSEYTEIRKRIAEEEKEQRRRELFE